MKARLLQLFHEIICILNGGHVPMLVMNTNEIFLRCHGCHWRSAGVDLRLGKVIDEYQHK